MRHASLRFRNVSVFRKQRSVVASLVVSYARNAAVSVPNSTGKKFSVVQFIARPFEEIDDYVCVPDNWVVIRKHQDLKINVSYPSDEEKSVTRERVKREEQYDDDWKFWTAEQKYQTDTFEDAELWITTGRDCVPLPPQNLSVNVTQSTSALNKELRSNKRKFTSGSKEDTPEMTAKPHKIARKPLPRVTIKRPASDDVEPEHKTKRGRKPATNAVEPTDAGAQSANAEPECSRRSASFENEPEIINIMDEGYHSQQDQQPTENDDNRQNNLVVDMPAAQNHSQSNRNALSNFQPQISNVQSLATTSNNEESRTNDSASNGPSISRERPESPSISAQIRQMMKGKRILKVEYVDIEKMKCPKNVRDRIIARQLASSNLNQNSSHQRPTIGPSAIGGRRIQPGDMPINFQYIPHVAERNVETTPNTAQNSRAVPQSVPSVVSARQNLSSSSQQHPNFDRQPTSRRELLQRTLGERRRDSRQHPNFDRQPTSRRELLQRTLGERRRDSRLQIPKPVSHLDPLGGTDQLNELIEALYQIQRLMNRQRSNLPEGGECRPAPANFSPSSRSPPTPPPQEATRESSSLLFLNLPNYVQRTLLATRGNILSDEERTRGNQGQGVQVNRPAPVQMTCYKNSDMKSQEIHADSGFELDEEALREIEAEDALLPPPKIVTHNLDDDLEFVSEEQMMDHGAPATDQMSSTLNSMINVFEKLQTAVLEATAACHTLLENRQRINSSGNLASQASTSRDSAIFVSASSNGCHDRNNMEVVPEVNPNPPLQIILPPEYDPADTAWTLKHEEDEPGLRELVPYTRIYIKFGELKYWEQVSEDCPSLARQILRGLFKRNALSVCASMTEKELNGRPKLNEHACAVLIDYVIGQGVKRRWNTDMQPILEALDDEVKKIRSEFGGRFTRQVV